MDEHMLQVLEMLEEILPEMLSITSTQAPYNLPRFTVEDYIADYFKQKYSPAVAEKCRSALLKELKANMERIKSNDQPIGDATCAMSWLLGVVRRCDAKLFEEVLKLFCKDSDLRNAITGNCSSYSPKAIEEMLDILINKFLTAMGNPSPVSSPAQFGVSFISDWLDTILTLLSPSSVNIVKYHHWLAALEEGMVYLGEALPLADQRRIYHMWREKFEQRSAYRCSALQWWTKKVHGAICPSVVE